MNLIDILKEIKDENLTREALERYDKHLTALYSEYMLRNAELEKEEGFFYDRMKEQHPEMSDIAITRKWRVSDEGIEFRRKEREIKVINKNLSSIKSRIYQTPNY